MAKKIDDVGGGAKKRTMKKRPKKQTIHKVVDYLLSDCYLFAPLISPSPYNSSRQPTKGKGIEVRERARDNRSLVKKIEDYLKSDCYMYASFVAPQSPRSECSVGYVRKVTKELSTTTTSVMSEMAANITKQKRICTADFVEATVMEQPNATTKEMYSNCRPLSFSGEGMRDPKRRKIVVD